MENIEKNKYYIWLSSIEKISTREKIRLLDKYKNPQILFDKSKKELEEELTDDYDNSSKIIKELTNTYYKIRLEIHIKNIKKYGIEVITYNDKRYPRQLRNITDYPICLYCKGNA